MVCNRRYILILPVQEIPDEVLRLILRQATIGEIIALDPAFEELWRSGNRAVPFLRKDNPSLPFKRDIVRVCRQWNRVGVEYLYEHLLVTDVVQLETLARSLCSKAGGLSKGWWTRRIDFGDIFHDRHPLDPPNKVYHELSLLTDHTPNLEVLGLQRLRNVPGNIRHLWKTPLLRRLEVLQFCSSPLFTLDFSNICQSNNIPLESLVLFLDGWKTSAGQKIHFPHLRFLHLSIGSSCDPPDNWDLPSLRHLTLDYCAIHSKLARVVKSYGPSLTSLEVGYWSTGTYSLYSLDTYLPLVPNLETLTYPPFGTCCPKVGLQEINSRLRCVRFRMRETRVLDSVDHALLTNHRRAFNKRDWPVLERIVAVWPRYYRMEPEELEVMAVPDL